MKNLNIKTFIPGLSRIVFSTDILITAKESMDLHG